MREKRQRKKEYPMARAYLEQVSIAKWNLEKLCQKRDNLRMLTTDTASHLTGLPRSDSPDLQRNETLIAEIDAVEEQIILAERAVRQKTTEVGLTICRLHHPTAQKTLMLHFLNGLVWKDIGKKLNYSLSTIYGLRDKGLRELEERNLIPE